MCFRVYNGTHVGTHIVRFHVLDDICVLMTEKCAPLTRIKQYAQFNWLFEFYLKGLRFKQSIAELQHDSNHHGDVCKSITDGMQRNYKEHANLRDKFSDKVQSRGTRIQSEIIWKRFFRQSLIVWCQIWVSTVIVLLLIKYINTTYHFLHQL